MRTRISFKDCKHPSTSDISGHTCTNKICIDCGGHLYESETTKLQWISEYDWDSWINSPDEFCGKGYEYWMKHKAI